jgi:hypothetical protein
MKKEITKILNSSGRILGENSVLLTHQVSYSDGSIGREIEKSPIISYTPDKYPVLDIGFSTYSCLLPDGSIGTFSDNH